MGLREKGRDSIVCLDRQRRAYQGRDGDADAFNMAYNGDDDRTI